MRNNHFFMVKGEMHRAYRGEVIEKCNCGEHPILVDFGPMAKTVLCDNREAHKGFRVLSKYKKTKALAVAEWNKDGGLTAS